MELDLPVIMDALLDKLRKEFSIAEIQRHLIEHNFPPIDFMTAFEIVEIARDDASNLLSQAKNETQRLVIRNEIKVIVNSALDEDTCKFHFSNIVETACSKSLQVVCHSIADALNEVLKNDENELSTKGDCKEPKPPKGEFDRLLTLEETCLFLYA